MRRNHVWLAAIILALLGNTPQAYSGPFDWWTFTGEGDLNNLLDPVNWRWAANTSTYPYLNDPVLDPNGKGFGHAKTSTDINTRWVLDGSTAAGGFKSVNVPAGITVNLTEGEIDGGFTLNINGGTFRVSNSFGSNAVWTDGLEMYNRYVANTVTQVYGGSSYIYFRANHQQSTVHVSNGGTFSAGSLYNHWTTGGNSYLTMEDPLWQMSNTGIFIDGKAHVNVGTFETTLSGGGAGGGFLKVKGYDAASTLSIDTIILKPANTTVVPNSSTSSLLSVILDASNTGGKFNAIQAATSLQIDDKGSYDTAVRFDLSLDGYTPRTGDWFQIINAPNLSNGTTQGTLGSISIGSYGPSWDTQFSISGSPATFAFHQSRNNVTGVWLEVTQGVPDTTWTGASPENGKWSTPENWSDGVPAGGGQLQFGVLGGSQATSVNDKTGMSFSGIRFAAGAASYTVVEETAGANGITLTGPVVNESANDQVISLPITLNAGTGVGSVDTGAANVTLGPVAGTAGIGLNKAGSGTLILTGTSTYRGTTNVNAGTLEVAAGGSIAPGTLNVKNSAKLTGRGTIDNTEILYTSDNASTFEGSIVGEGTAVEIDNAAGSLILAGNNSYGGGTYVTSGTVIIASAGALPHGRSLTIGSGGSLVLGGGSPLGTMAAASIQPVPEPSSLVLLAVALAAGGVAWRRRA